MSRTNLVTTLLLTLLIVFSVPASANLKDRLSKPVR